jgi:hypothetical protein
VNSEPEDTEDEPLTAEEQAKADQACKKIQDAWEAQATKTYGPPEVRDRKNRRYAMRLIRKHSEETVRGILKALSTLDDPTCCENLRSYNLDEEPLEQIICPFDLLGLHFSISTASETLFTVDIGQSYDTVGSGGQFQLERLSDGSFRISDTTGLWIA